MVCFSEYFLFVLMNSVSNVVFIRILCHCPDKLTLSNGVFIRILPHCSDKLTDSDGVFIRILNHCPEKIHCFRWCVYQNVN